MVKVHSIALALIACAAMSTPASAEWDAGNCGIRANGQLIGRLTVNATTETWDLGGTVLPDHFAVGGSAAGAPLTHTFTYDHQAFSAGTTAMPSVSNGPTAWRLSCAVGGTVNALSVVMTRNQANGDLAYFALSASLNNNSHIACGGEVLFDRITSNPQGMASGAAVRAVIAPAL